MRVAVAHPVYWPEVRRGAERLAHDLAGGLHARGHAVRIVTSHPGATTRRDEEGVDVVRVRRPPGGTRLQRRLFEPYLEALPGTYAALRRGNDDVVCALHVADAAAALRAGRPTVYWHMGVPHRAWMTARRGRRALTEAAVQAGAVLALSAFARDAFAHWLGVEAQVAHPPVDSAHFTPGGERAEHPTIVCAADAGEPRKRVELLVEAFAAVRREHPRARLLLDARTAGHLSGPGVEAVDMTDLRARYREAWVSALPSWGEAFGLVLAEALACGTPVVGADRDGIPEVLGDADGIGTLFTDDLARALLEAIDLAGDPQTAARCRARAEVFSVAACAERMDALLQRVADRIEV